MVIILDNYDSFTYNLVQYVGSLGVDTLTIRNDAATLQEIIKMEPEAIIISPGPGIPEDAGISVSLIQAVAGKIPILGVCLGHQAIAYAFGGKIAQAPEIIHGKTSPIYHDNSQIYKDLPNPFIATRYHSLIVEKDTFPSILQITATTDSDLIMGIKHLVHPIFGVQFHPESFATDNGIQIIKNLLEIISAKTKVTEK